MKRTIAMVAAATVGSLVVMAPGAQAAPTRDLYMVKNLQQASDGIYIGDFAALRKSGKRVVGAVGAFSSEYVCVKGKVKSGRFRGAYYEYGVVQGYFSRKWRGYGANQHIKGMTPVSWASMSTYLGSDPDSLIQDCVNTT
jgi:hypothetical protein